MFVIGLIVFVALCFTSCKGKPATKTDSSTANTASLVAQATEQAKEPDPVPAPAQSEDPVFAAQKEAAKNLVQITGEAQKQAQESAQDALDSARMAQNAASLADDQRRAANGSRLDAETAENEIRAWGKKVMLCTIGLAIVSVLGAMFCWFTCGRAVECSTRAREYMIRTNEYAAEEQAAERRVKQIVADREPATQPPAA